jgi:cytochrome c peroxidase
MLKFLYLIIVSILVFNAGCSDNSNRKERVDLNSKEKLGKLLFNDKNLSTPPGQACADCHAESAGFADPLKEIPVSRGVYKDRFGNRNDLTVAYASFAPEFHFDSTEGIYIGGFFWDGRATTLAEQAMAPPLNPLEMANGSADEIIEKIKGSDYSRLFADIYGKDVYEDPERAYAFFGDALAAYQSSAEINKFSSKYDYYLRGEIELSDTEMKGLSVFNDPLKGNCAACHPSMPSEEGTPPLFTDFTYDNLGIPKNPESPYYYLPEKFNPDGVDYIDFGLGAVVDKEEELGKFKVPTLRNIALTGPYMHNGLFKSIRQVISFYNTRDIGGWPEPEIKINVNHDELGNLGLTEAEIDYLVAFLRTLTDDYVLPE